MQESSGKVQSAPSGIRPDSGSGVDVSIKPSNKSQNDTHKAFSDEQLERLKSILKRCSPETIEAAIRFRKTGDPQAVSVVVYGIIQRYLPSGSTVCVAEAPDEARLIEDLGIDSLTMLEIVMAIEEALDVKIDNEELRQITTLGQVKTFLERKVKESPAEALPPSSTRKYDRDAMLAILPHGYPFFFIDEAEIDGAVVRARYAIKGSEFFLAGHFREEPVFPASIVFEAMGQVACLWALEEIPKSHPGSIREHGIFFASMEGAHFYRKTGPGDLLEFTVTSSRVRPPMAVFCGDVTVKGEKVARVEQLVLAFGSQVSPENVASEPPADGATSCAKQNP